MPPDGPFHAGELAAQARAGVAARGAGIRNFMPDQHRIFFGQLPWLFASVLDGEGWPLATTLTGVPGFVTSPAPTSLSISALPFSGDPASDAIRPGSPIGLLGLEFETRRRNRANGRIEAVGPDGFSVAVTQSFGNCAKYIQARRRAPNGSNPARAFSSEVDTGSREENATKQEPGAVPRFGESRDCSRQPASLSSLDAAAQALIANADTLFIASAAALETPLGGVDISHRGGQPGFVRIDGDTLTIPDFAGNNYFNTLGNLLEQPRAALLFVDFETGTTLQLQGMAEVVWDGPELAGLEGSQRLWRFNVTRGWRRPHALALRWSAPEFAPATLQTGLWSARAALAAG